MKTWPCIGLGKSEPAEHSSVTGLAKKMCIEGTGP